MDSKKKVMSCPKCRSEVYYSNPHFILTSNPPRMDIKCSKCNYKGYVFV